MKLITNAYNLIKQDVFQAKYKPNELITAKQISEKYGVSRVSVNEALHRLCSEGHLTSYPRSGYMVTVLTPREMQQLKRTRRAVESLVIDVICEEAEDEAIKSLYDRIEQNFSGDKSASVCNFNFHISMARLTDDKFVINLTETLLGSISRVEQHISPELYLLWQDYHKDIVDALVKRNPEAAKSALLKDLN